MGGGGACGGGPRDVVGCTLGDFGRSMASEGGGGACGGSPKAVVGCTCGDLGRFMASEGGVEPVVAAHRL